MSEPSDTEIGIAIRLVQQFDAEREREESLRRDAEMIRAWRLLKMPCSETKQ
jgi:hypothetical protein